MTATQVLPAPTPTPDDPAAALGPGKSPRAKRHPLRWLLAGAAVAGTLFWAGWHSPWTTVTELGVSVPKGISAKAVRAASGLNQAWHVPEVDPAAIELAIMEQIPAVASVEVQRKLPHTVNLVVTAREPLGALAMTGDFMLIDADGVAYARVKKIRDLPVIRAKTDEGRTSALAVLGSVPEQLRKRITIVKASTAQDVVIVLDDGAQVRWGSAADPDLKVEVLAALLQVKAEFYDVSAPMLPTTQGSLASPSPTP